MTKSFSSSLTGFSAFFGNFGSKRPLSHYFLKYILRSKKEYNLNEKYVKNFEGLSKEKYIDLRKAIKNIQEDFIITYVDKASTNYAIICKKLYGEILREHCENTNNYELIGSKLNEAENRIRVMYKKF